MQTCKSNFTEIFYIHRQPGEKKQKTPNLMKVKIVLIFAKNMKYLGTKG